MKNINLWFSSRTAKNIHKTTPLIRDNNKNLKEMKGEGLVDALETKTN